MEPQTSRHPNANATQQARRAGRVRIDYQPSPEALATLKANLGDRYPLTIYSGLLDRIVIEWAADLAGERAPDLPSRRPEFLHSGTRARVTPAPRVRATCGARTKAGTPCRTRPLPGRCRCKWHGGASTGPKTAEGKARALANLQQYRKPEND